MALKISIKRGRRLAHIHISVTKASQRAQTQGGGLDSTVLSSLPDAPRGPHLLVFTHACTRLPQLQDVSTLGVTDTWSVWEHTLHVWRCSSLHGDTQGRDPRPPV